LKMRTQHKLSLHRETLKHRNKKRAKVTASPGSSVHQHQKFMNRVFCGLNMSIIKEVTVYLDNSNFILI
ncbi:hypothetical protein, partial [Ruoffia tabacinasalis]|uniref:hypothetical protein n=1 Tax=Ruoffia tabacinasalis TaxID=87458 RepID=UPI001BB1325A